MELEDSEIEARIAELAGAEPMTRAGVNAQLAMRDLVAKLRESTDETRGVVHIEGTHGFNEDFVASQMLLLALIEPRAFTRPQSERSWRSVTQTC